MMTHLGGALRRVEVGGEALLLPAVDQAGAPSEVIREGPVLQDTTV